MMRIRIRANEIQIIDAIEKDLDFITGRWAAVKVRSKTVRDNKEKALDRTMKLRNRFGKLREMIEERE